MCDPPVSLCSCSGTFPAIPSGSATDSSPFAHSDSIESHCHGSMRSHHRLSLPRGLFSETQKLLIWTRSVKDSERGRRFCSFQGKMSAETEVSTFLLTRISSSMIDSHLALLSNRDYSHNVLFPYPLRVPP